MMMDDDDPTTKYVLWRRDPVPYPPHIGFRTTKSADQAIFGPPFSGTSPKPLRDNQFHDTNPIPWPTQYSIVVMDSTNATCNSPEWSLPHPAASERESTVGCGGWGRNDWSCLKKLQLSSRIQIRFWSGLRDSDRYDPKSVSNGQ